jgi:hypothetical protein
MEIKKTTFDGKQAIEITGKKIKMIVVTSCGPRIAWWGWAKGENLLFWDTKDRQRGEWKLMGGHRIWITRPLADESEDTYRHDNKPCKVESKGGVVTITAGTDPVLNVQKSLRIEFLNDNTMQVDNAVTNVGTMLASGGVWALTCTLPVKGRAYGVPLGDGSEWDGFRVTMFRKWGGHASPLNDPQTSFTPDCMVIKPQGIETKRMIEAPHGIIAMDAPDQKTTFIKKTGFVRGAQYPMSSNIAFYVGPDNFMVEMETMGPESTMKPGEAIRNVEQWILTDGSVGVAQGEKLLAATKKYLA